MIKLTTPVEVSSEMPTLGYTSQVLLMGSCFADRLGQKLVLVKLKCDVNPFGTLYNPLSIAQALQDILTERHYVAQDLLQHQGYWHSLMHHGDFSCRDANETLSLINGRIGKAHEELKGLTHLFLTFGSAWVFERHGQVVSNCHKLPAHEFTRRKLTVEEIVGAYIELLASLWKVAPQTKVVMTVSPIRHLHDGLHQNQLSKATLLLAIDRLQELYPDKIHYFPAYELLMDELRDYRFYADDLTHPSEVAVQLVWERFREAFANAKTQQWMDEAERIQQMLEHRPLQQESEAYQQFLRQLITKIDELQKLCPTMDWSKERELCSIKLEK